MRIAAFKQIKLLCMTLHACIPRHTGFAKRNSWAALLAIFLYSAMLLLLCIRGLARDQKSVLAGFGLVIYRLWFGLGLGQGRLRVTRFGVRVRVRGSGLGSGL